MLPFLIRLTKTLIDGLSQIKSVHLFSFSETSFEKQCHKGLTRAVQPEKVASRIGQISSEPHILLAWQIGMC